jgi:hypothetical protein
MGKRVTTVGLIWEDHDAEGFPPVVKRSQHVFPGRLHMRDVVERIKEVTP